MSGGGWDLDEIRRRADIVDIVSPHVRLRKAGRRLSGLCPFHQERTPSFTVDAEKGLWHCFGCKAGGDLFRFVEMIEKVTFQEAVELLANRLGLPPRTPADAARTRARERFLSLHEQAARFFHGCLKTEPTKAALKYLRRRGVSDESIEGFLLGYAPDAWDGLLNALSKQGFSGKELGRAGLAVQRNDGGFYDRFRNRVIFPIRDATGGTIAFGGRALADDQQPKYLNSPETPLFRKGQTLWAFDRARRAMADSGRAIVVEGYLDAIACHEAGLSETIATMGTALTGDHVELLRRRTDRLVLAFDSDSAGLAAALRGRELFQRAGLDVRVVTMPEGMDPDNVIRDRGREAFLQLVEAAAPMLEWELSRILERAARAEGRARAEAVDAAVALVAQLPPGAVRDYSKHWLGERIRMIAEGAEPRSHERRRELERELVEALDRGIRRRKISRTRRSEDTPPRQGPAERQRPARPPAGRVSTSLLAAFLEHGEMAARYMGMLQRSDFPDPQQQDVFDAIAGLVERNEPVTPKAVLAEVDPEARGLLAQVALEQVPNERVEEFLEAGVRRLVGARLQRRERELLKAFGESASTEEREALRQELNEVARQRSALAGERIVGTG